MAACPKAPTCLFFSPLSPFWVPEEAPCCCTAAMVTRVALQGLFLGADCSESRGLRPQLCARLKLLAEVEAGERERLSGGCSPRKQPVGAWSWWLAPSWLFLPSLGSQVGLVSWSCSSRAAGSNCVV